MLYKFQLLWWKNVPLLGLWVCFTCDLFIVTNTMLDVGRISGYHFESRQHRDDSVNSCSNWLSSFREDFRIISIYIGFNCLLTKNCQNYKIINKTDCYDINEILLKVVLNTLTLGTVLKSIYNSSFYLLDRLYWSVNAVIAG